MEFPPCAVEFAVHRCGPTLPLAAPETLAPNVTAGAVLEAVASAITAALLLATLLIVKELLPPPSTEPEMGSRVVSTPDSVKASA